MTEKNAKGTALVLVLLVVSILMLSGAALLAKVISTNRLMGTEQHRTRALYIAEAGMGRARWRLGLAPDFTSVPPPDALYTDEPFSGGTYSVLLSERTPEEVTITSSGTYGSVTRTVSVRIRSGGAWWNSAWQFRRLVEITENTGMDLADYQVKISVPFSASMNPDASDFRFVDSDGSELSYWVEAVEGGRVLCWIKVPTLTSGSSTPVYLYYGNPSAAPASDFSSVMEPEYLKYNIAPQWTTRVSAASVATGDDVGAWVDMQFEFPYYHVSETRLYACSNGYISFGDDYGNSNRNSERRLRNWRMIAPFWDELRTDTIYGVCDEPGIYLDSYSDRILVDFEAYARLFGFLRGAGLFQATLFRCGDIVISRGDSTNDWIFTETVGISRGAARVYVDVTPESAPGTSWLFAMRKYVEPEPSATVGAEETSSPTIAIYWKEE